MGDGKDNEKPGEKIVKDIKAVAVHQDWQGKGIGQALIIHALYRALEIADEVGSAAVVLDILRDEGFDRRSAFYSSLGFQPLGEPDNPDRFSLSMKDSRATLRA